jgi:hypothetical protein
MPRDYHIGVKGTFMNAKTHSAYFANIAPNTDTRVDWSSERGQAAVDALPIQRYEEAIISEISQARILRGVDVRTWNLLLPYRCM